MDWGNTRFVRRYTDGEGRFLLRWEAQVHHMALSDHEDFGKVRYLIGVT